MSKPWRTLSSETLVADRWINLRADRCVTEGGIEVSPYYVLAYPDWVHVVALTPEDEIVLVRQYRHGVGAIVTEVPGGVVDAADADLAGAAARELAEETGFRANSLRLISTLWPNPAVQTNRVHVFLAQGATREGGQTLDAGEEGLEAFTMPVADVVDGLAGGLLGQSLHAAAVLMALMASGRLALAGSGRKRDGSRRGD